MTGRLILGSLLFILALGMVAQCAQAHEPYSEWRVPANPAVSCCNGEDCRPTRAFMHEDGFWRAWTGEEWLKVPTGALLPPDLAKDGRSHLCEKGGYVYCFSPGQARF